MDEQFNNFMLGQCGSSHEKVCAPWLPISLKVAPSRTVSSNQTGSRLEQLLKPLVLSGQPQPGGEREGDPNKDGRRGGTIATEE